MSDAMQGGLTRCSALVPTTAIERFPRAFSRFLVELRKTFGGYRLAGAQLDSPAGVVDDAQSVGVTVDVPERPGFLEAFDALIAGAARDLRERSVLVSVGSAIGVIRAQEWRKGRTSLRARSVA